MPGGICINIHTGEVKFLDGLTQNAASAELWRSMRFLIAGYIETLNADAAVKALTTNQPNGRDYYLATFMRWRRRSMI